MNLAQLTNDGIEIIAVASGDGEPPGANQETRRDTVVLRTRLTELIVGQPDQDRHSLFGMGGAPRLSQLTPQASAHQVRVLVGHLPRGIHIGQLTQQEGHGLPRLAEGLSNQAIANRLVVSEPAVVKHVGNILTKLDLPPDGNQNRRVMAVLAYLNHNP